MNTVTSNKKQQIEINWPSTSFTFSNLKESNASTSDATLRKRLKEALENNQVIRDEEKIHKGGPGRGQYVYSLRP